MGSTAYEEARLMGRLLAEEGFTVMNGGFGGTMEAVSRGAAEAGGHVIGITVSSLRSRKLTPNAWIKAEIRKPNYLSRLSHLVLESDGAIALQGSVGTLTETFMTWSLLEVEAVNWKPLIAVGDPWKQALRVLVREALISEEDLKWIHVVSTPYEAIAVLQEKLAQVK